MEIKVNDFGKLLKSIRLHCSCSQIQFCEKLGIPTGTYSAWETGRFLPTIHSMESLYKGLEKLNIEEFYIERLKDTYYRIKVSK